AAMRLRSRPARRSPSRRRPRVGTAAQTNKMPQMLPERVSARRRCHLGATSIWRSSMANPQSTAKIAGHPIHPMLVPFPIAFYVATLVCDLVYLQTGYPSWADATPWLLGAALVMSALAVTMGFIDVAGDARIRRLADVWWHAGANATAAVIQLINW